MLRDASDPRAKRHKKLLASLYHVDQNGELRDMMLQADTDPNFPLNTAYAASQMSRDADDDVRRAADEAAADDDDASDLPISKPDNITVTLFSWTPPSIRVGWDYGEPQPKPTPAPDYPVPFPSVHPAAAGAGQAKATTTATARNEETTKLRLEAFRIIYHPSVTK